MCEDFAGSGGGRRDTCFTVKSVVGLSGAVLLSQLQKRLTQGCGGDLKFQDFLGSLVRPHCKIKLERG